MKKPFTLVEVLIAMSVLSVFLLGLMQFYSSTETVLSSGVERTEMFERARIAMDMMANDLTCTYYSQWDKESVPFTSDSNSFSVSTIRPEKLNNAAKTNIIGVKYNLSGNTLYYTYDATGDTFSVDKGINGPTTELVEGVTEFNVKPYCAEGTKLPALVVIRMTLVDKKTLKRMEANANSSVKFDDKKREFRRMVVIDRGQPKPSNI